MNLFGWDLPPGCSLCDIDAAFGDEQGDPAELTDEQMVLLVPILPSGEDFAPLSEEDLP